MSTFTFSVCLLIFAILLFCGDGALAKRGCAAFGHSCYGGHGKRSQGIDLIPPGSEMSDIDLNRRTLGDQDAILPEQFSRVHDVLQKPDREVETLLQRLAKSNENQRIFKKYLNEYTNY